MRNAWRIASACQAGWSSGTTGRWSRLSMPCRPLGYHNPLWRSSALPGFLVVTRFAGQVSRVRHLRARAAARAEFRAEIERVQRYANRHGVAGRVELRDDLVVLVATDVLPLPPAPQPRA